MRPLRDFLPASLPGVFLAVLVSLGASCTAREGVPPAMEGRPPDGLLNRPDLQTVVDLQVERDGSGLISLLRHADPVVRARAAFALASVQDANAVPALRRLLMDDDPRVRADAAFAVGQTADSTAAEALLEAWGRELDRTAWGAQLEAIGRCGGYLALQVVAAADVPLDRRADIALAIGRFGLRSIHDPAAVDRVVTWLTDRDRRLRSYAAYYFSRLRQTTPWEAEADRVRGAMDSWGAAEPAAMYLVLALGRLEGERDTARIAGRLRDAHDWRVRVNAALALGSHTADAGARAALLGALGERSLHVALAAAGGLAASDHVTEEERAAVRAWTDDDDTDWRLSGALLPIVVADGDVVYAKEWMARHEGEDERIRSLGIGALSGARGESAFEELRRAAIGDDAAVATAAVEALGSRWRSRNRGAPPQTYFEIFSAAVTSGEVAVAFAAAPLLADRAFRSLGVVDVLARAWRGMSTPVDLEPMVAVLDALGRTGDTEVLPLLSDAADHDEAVIREAAVRARDRITGEQSDVQERPGRAQRTIDWERLAAIGPAPMIRLETEKGEILVAFDTEEAPLTTQTLIGLTEDGKYDGVPFHRVVPNFVIQGGDFASADGFGGPGFVIRSEFTRLPYLRGAAGMASAGKDTEGSQFFFTHSMQPHLDGRYTTFGVVVRGLDVVDRILQGDQILRATVVSR